MSGGAGPAGARPLSPAAGEGRGRRHAWGRGVEGRGGERADNGSTRGRAGRGVRAWAGGAGRARATWRAPGRAHGRDRGRYRGRALQR